MKLYIPTVGDSIILTADWLVNIHNEDRNETIMELFNDNRKMVSRWSNDTTEERQYMIPAGETLKIDRIYIRKGQGDFDSVTFLWVGNSIPAKTVQETNWKGDTFDRRVPKKPIRFWAKLDCVNNIEFVPAP